MFFSNLKHAKLQNFLSGPSIADFQVKLKQANVWTHRVLSMFVFLSHCLSVHLFICSVTYFSGMAHYGSLGYLKTDRALFPGKFILIYIFFNLINIFIQIHWNILFFLKIKTDIVIDISPQITHLAKLWFLSYGPNLVSANQTAIFFKN